MRLLKQNKTIILLIAVAIILFLADYGVASETKPEIFLSDKGQAILFFDTPDDIMYNSSQDIPNLVYWEAENEIRFIHATDLRFNKNQCGIYQWQVGENETVPLDKAPDPLSIDMKIESSTEKLMLHIFPQLNGYLQFAYTQHKATIYFANGENTLEIGSIELPNEMIKNSFYFVDNVVYDESDWIVITVCNDPYNALLIYQVSTGTYRIIEDMNIKQIAPYAPGKILFYHAGAIKTFSLQSGEIGSAMVLTDDPLDATSRSFAYDDKQNVLYYLSDGDLYRMHSSGVSELIVIAPLAYLTKNFMSGPLLPFKMIIRNLLPLLNGQIAYELSGKLCVITPTAHEREMGTLTISTSYSDVVYGYHLMNPHVAIVKYPCFSIERINEYDPTCDVYELSSGSHNLQKYFHEGYAASLSAVSIIEENTNTYITPAQNLLRHNGNVMAVPIQMAINPWYINDKKWQEYNLPTIPQTVDELFELIRIWETEYSEQYPNDFLLADGDLYEFKTCLHYMLTKQYMFEYSGEEPVRFNTESYVSLLKKALALPELPLGLIDEDGYPLLYGAAYVPYSLMSLRSISDALDDKNKAYLPMGSDYIPIMPVSLSTESKARLGACIDAFIMHPDAPNPALAKDFLSFVSMHPELCQSDLGFMLSPKAPDEYGLNEVTTSFYLQHIDDLSFSWYAPWASAEMVDTLRELNQDYLDKTGSTTDEAVQRVIDEMNSWSHVDW